MTDKEDHIQYMMLKSQKSREHWKHIMQNKGLFSDFFESEESTVKSNTKSNKPTKKTPSEDTSEVHSDNKW